MEKKHLLLALVILSGYLLLKKSTKKKQQCIIVCGLVVLLFFINKNKTLDNIKNNIKNNYIISVIVGKAKDIYNGAKGVYLDIYNDRIKALFVGTKKGILDKLLVYSKKDNAMIDIANRTNICSTNETYGCIAIDLDKDGYTDLIVARDDGVTLYKNIKGTGQFKPIKLLVKSSTNTNQTKPIGLLLSNKNEKQVLHTSNYNDIKNNKNSKMFNFMLANNGNHKLLSVTDHILSNHLQKQYDMEHFNPIKVDVDKNGSEDNLYLDINGPVEVKNEKVDNFFGVDLPCNDEFIGSQVVVKAGDKMFNDTFNGYLLKFNIGDIPIVDDVQITTPNNKKYTCHKKVANSIFTIIPSKNVVSYYSGNRSGNSADWKSPSCVHKLDYISHNNLNTNYSMETKLTNNSRKSIVNLMDHQPGQYSPTFKASYDKGARGYNYYKIDVNQYKAPINVGDKPKWKNQTCLANLEYKKLNNLNTNYSLGHDLPKEKKKIMANLLLPPTKSNNPNKLNKITYKDNERGGSFKHVCQHNCVLNRDYVRHNNQNKNYGHGITKYTTKNKQPLNQKINLIKPPDKTNTYLVSYYSMNRVQN